MNEWIHWWVLVLSRFLGPRGPLVQPLVGPSVRRVRPQEKSGSYLYTGINGSVSAGREKWPFNVIFLSDPSPIIGYACQ